MTKSDNRALRSLERSIQHRRQVLKDRIVFGIAAFCALGIPLLYFGALEYGLARPIQNEQFNYYLGISRSIAWIVAIWYIPGFIDDRRRRDAERERRKEEEAKKKAEPPDLTPAA